MMGSYHLFSAFDRVLIQAALNSFSLGSNVFSLLITPSLAPIDPSRLEQ